LPPETPLEGRFRGSETSAERKAAVMRRAAIYFFSGTGNTEFVSRLVERELLRNGVAAARHSLDFATAIDLAPYDAVFLGFPIHGFGVPVPVRSFIEKLPRSDSKKAVVFSTYGGFSCGSEKWAARLLAARGLVPVGTLGIRMPHINPPGVSISRQEVEKLVARAEAKIAKAVPSLIRATQRVGTFSLSRTAISSWLNPLAIDHELVDFSFSKRAFADERCTGCLRCLRACPTGCISMRDGTVQFGEACCSCLRCYYGCPSSAIQTDRSPPGAPRYRGPAGDYRSPTRPAAATDVRPERTAVPPVERRWNSSAIAATGDTRAEENEDPGR